jgi:hypothetical protein
MAAALLAACGSTQTRVDPDQHRVEAPGASGRLSYQYGPVPASWRPMSIEGNDVAWSDEASHGVVHADHSCERSQDTPLTALVQHLLVGFTEREFISEETIPFDGREARHVTVRARLDGVPMMLDLYVMKKDGCVYDLGLVAPPEGFPRILPAFSEFVRGFHTINTGLPPQVSAEQPR